MGCGGVAVDGKVYCIPYSSNDVMVIDPTAPPSTAMYPGVVDSIHVPNSIGSGGQKWAGGTVATDPVTGTSKIYAAPYSAEQLLIIDPASPRAAPGGGGPSTGGFTANIASAALV